MYDYFSDLTKNRILPVGGTNVDGEDVIIEKGKRDGQNFFKVGTLQNNGWIRVNYYWEDGTREELYEH